MTDPDKPGTSRRWCLLPRTIYGLAICFALGSALVTTILAAATFEFVHGEIERQIDQRIAVETEALVDYEREYGFDALLNAVRTRDRQSSLGPIGYLTSRDEQERALGYIVLDRSGRQVAGSLRARTPPPGWSEFVRFTRPDGSKGVAQAMNSPLSGGRLIVAGDRASLNRMDRLISRLFAAAFGALLLLGGITAIAFGRIVRRRIAAIETSAQAIIAGDITRRLPLDGTGVELDRLSMVLNQMLDQIAALVQNLRHVSTNLAHDLRTPLSRLRLKLERAQALSKEGEQQTLLHEAIEASDNLLQLFAGLLAIAEIDGQRVRARFERLDLADALTEIAEAYRASFEDVGQSLVIDAQPVAVWGDRALLQQLVGNLLDNVLRHAPGGTTATVTIRKVEDQAIVTVQDDGPGVPASERARIFDRLVRLDAARSTPGNGLGLSLVSSIAMAHGGTAYVEPSPVGLLVVLDIPAVP